MKGCFGCKHLEWYEGDSFMGEPESAYGCNKRELNYDKIKFPFKRKTKCFEQAIKELEGKK